MPARTLGAITDAVTGIGGFINTLIRQDIEDERYLENRDYERALQERIFEREDSAYQRAVQDAEMAGLSPVAVTGSGGLSSGAVVSRTSPQSSLNLSPTQLFDTLRGIQELELAEDANEREWETVRAGIALDMEKLQLAKTQQTLDFQLQSSSIFNQSQRWLWEKEQTEKEFGHKVDFDWRKFKADLAKQNFEMESWTKDFDRQGIWFDQKHDLEYLDTVWSNINGSVHAGSNLLDSILPSGWIKNITDSLSDVLKKRKNSFGKRPDMSWFNVR